MARPRLINRAARLGVSYARYSTTMQATVEQQHRTNRGTGAEFDVKIVREFSDRAKSRDMDREELEEMFAYLEAHPEVGFIVVNELERMTTGVTQRSRIAEICRRLQVTIVTEDMGLVDPNDEQKMHEADERSVKSDGELIRVRRRVKRFMKDLAHEDDRFIMRPCYGMRNRTYASDGTPMLPDEISPEGLIVRAGPWELHPDEYPWLVKMYDLADRGWVDGHIIKLLVEQGVPTKTGKAHWQPCTIKQILTNDFYVGVYEYGKNEVRRLGKDKYLDPRPDVHPNRVTRPSPLGEMVDADLWERVQAKRAERRASGDARYLQTGRRVVEEQLFDGRVFCARCGYRMGGQFDVARTPTSDPPFRYTCKKGGAVSREQKVGFAPPCAESHSITDRQILEQLASFGSHTRFVSADPFRHDMDRITARKEADVEERAAKISFERTKALFKKDMATEDEIDAEKAAWDRAAKKAAGLRRGGKAPVVVPRYLGELDWTDLASVLANEALPVSNRQAVLTEGGLARLYIDSPVVLPQFVSR